MGIIDPKLIKQSRLSVQVTAINKGKKEQIFVDGEVFLNSVNVRRWNFVVKLSYTDESGDRKEVIGKSATKQGAQKWEPYAMERQFIGKVPTEFKSRAVARRSKSYGNLHVIPYTNITREIAKVERES